MGRIAQFWNKWLGRVEPAEPHLWHPWRPLIIPFRCADGQLGWGVDKVWRRRRNGQWEYQEDPLTQKEWDDSL